MGLHELINIYIKYLHLRLLEPDCPAVRLAENVSPPKNVVKLRLLDGNDGAKVERPAASIMNPPISVAFSADIGKTAVAEASMAGRKELKLCRAGS
jgi:hypothetical protein